MRYPPDMTSEQYVQFRHSKYSARGGGGIGGGITLYMPEDTPAVSFRNGWSRQDYPGPLGKLRLGLAKEGAAAIQEATGRGGNLKQVSENFISNVTDQFKKQGSVGEYAEQGGLQAAAEFANLKSASHLLSITKGEIYNPNVELVYEGPSLRDYTFTFNFAPKNEADAAAACEIVREFKMYSAASLTGGNKLEIPHIWHINYANDYMGKFKPAACMDVNVDYNPGLAMHMNFPSGMPIITSMSLSFREVEFVFRQDHSQGRMGF